MAAVVAVAAVLEAVDLAEADREAECPTAVVSTDPHPDPDIMVVGITAAVTTEADALVICSA